MSLSVPALLEAAVEASPDGRIEVGAGCYLTVVALDRHSRAAAGALLAAGYGQGTVVRVAPEPGPERAIGLLAAWRIGLVVSDDPDAPQPRALELPSLQVDHENLRRVAESRVWSQTPAAVTNDAVVLTHADIVSSLNLGDGAIPAVQALARYPSDSPTTSEPS